MASLNETSVLLSTISRQGRNWIIEQMIAFENKAWFILDIMYNLERVVLTDVGNPLSNNTEKLQVKMKILKTRIAGYYRPFISYMSIYLI